MSDSNLFRKIVSRILDVPWIAYTATIAAALMAILGFIVATDDGFKRVSGWISGDNESGITVLDLSSRELERLNGYGADLHLGSMNVNPSQGTSLQQPHEASFSARDLKRFIVQTQSLTKRETFAEEVLSSSKRQDYRFEMLAERTEPIAGELRLKLNLTFRNDGERRKLLNGMRITNILPAISTEKTSQPDSGSSLESRVSSTFFVNDWPNIISPQHVRLRPGLLDELVLLPNIWVGEYRLTDNATGELTQFVVEAGEVFSWDIELLFNDYSHEHLVELAPRIDGRYSPIPLFWVDVVGR